jgi:hypothetical protein
VRDINRVSALASCCNGEPVCGLTQPEDRGAVAMMGLVGLVMAQQSRGESADWFVACQGKLMVVNDHGGVDEPAARFDGGHGDRRSGRGENR